MNVSVPPKVSVQEGRVLLVGRLRRHANSYKLLQTVNLAVPSSSRTAPAARVPEVAILNFLLSSLTNLHHLHSQYAAHDEATALAFTATAIPLTPPLTALEETLLANALALDDHSVSPAVLLSLQGEERLARAKAARSWRRIPYTVRDSVQFFSKVIDMFAESIPDTLLQVYVMVKSGEAPSSAVGSVVVSALTTGFTSASMSFDFDVGEWPRTHRAAHT